jgi:hypothetical protein
LFWDKENGVVPEFPTAKLKYLAEAGFRLENASNKSQSSDRISVEEDNFSLTNLAVYYMLICWLKSSMNQIRNIVSSNIKGLKNMK